MKVQTKHTLGFAAIIAAVIVGGFVLSYIISEQTEKIALESKQQNLVSLVSHETDEYLTKNDFDLGNYDEKKLTFDKFFTLFDREDIIRFKVWAPDGTVIYSDDQNIVGKKFAGNVNFQESIKGFVEAEIKEPVKPENISEVGFEQLMEVYVPVYLESSQPVGVIEVYYDLATVNAQIQESVLSVTWVVGMTIIAVIAITFAFYMSISRGFLKPLAKLADASNEIAKANYDIKLKKEGSEEVQEIIDAYNKMITNLKKNIELEKELAAEKEITKQEKLSTMGLLAARLSHDLRNPLSVLKLALDVVKYTKDPAKFDERISIMEDSLARVTHQIDNVLDFVRNKDLVLISTGLEEITDRSIKSQKIPDGIKITKELHGIKIWCDSKQIEVLLNNLILNAIHALDEKGEITIRAKEKEKSTTIEVEDSGKGVSDENMNKIFDPLFTTKQRGTGLGLASCKSIAEQHGGTITVSNNPSIFSVILPKNIKKEIDVIKSKKES